MKLGIFVGLAGLDMVYYQNKLPIENSKSKTNDYAVHVGGPAANAAITYSLLGGKALLITSIGNSEMGKLIKQELNDYGVEMIDYAEDMAVLPSISSISISSINASRTIWSGQQSIPHYEEQDISEEIEAAAFCLSDCNLFGVSKQVLSAAKLKAIPIILDAGSWKEEFEFYLSVAEAAIASSSCKPPLSNQDFLSVAKRYGVQNSAVTSGEGLIKWTNSEGCGQFMPPTVEALDTLGAGDIFHGAYCYFRYVKALSFVKALEKAAEVASLSVQFYGPREGFQIYNKRAH